MDDGIQKSAKYHEDCGHCGAYVLPLLEYKSFAPGSAKQHSKSCPECGRKLPLNNLDREMFAQMRVADNNRYAVERARQRSEQALEEALRKAPPPVRYQPQFSPPRGSGKSRSKRLEERADRLSEVSVAMMKFGCMLTIAVPVILILIAVLIGLASL